MSSNAAKVRNSTIAQAPVKALPSTSSVSTADSRSNADSKPSAPLKSPETGGLSGSLGGDVIDACAIPMIIFENRAGDCLVRYVNPAFSDRTGYSRADIAGFGWEGLHMDARPEGGVERIHAAIAERRELEIPLRIHGKDGMTFSATLHLSPVSSSAAGTGMCAVGVLREQTADAEYITRLERDAHYDPLTGLPNRRLLIERAKPAITRALREGHLLGVALIDLDGFKLINDTLGHAAGDQVLCAVGARLARDLRLGDLIARVGGDEFVLLLQEANGSLPLASIVERVRRHVEEPIHVYGQAITIACSIGVAICPEQGKDLDTLLAQADRAMYRQKALHRSKRVA